MKFRRWYFSPSFRVADHSEVKRNRRVTAMCWLRWIPPISRVRLSTSDLMLTLDVAQTNLGKLQIERIDLLGALITHEQGNIVGTQPQPGGPRV